MLKIRNYFLILTLLCSVGINAATLFVESLDDTLGTAATLRQTILDAVSGDTIQFGVSGTILLDEFLGELVVDKQLTIDGQNKIIVDGQDQINICFHITNSGTADASNSIIQNITIQNFNGHEVDPGSGTASQELDAFGILVDVGPENCSALNTTIKNINAGMNKIAAGIRSLEIMTRVGNNIISNVSSSSSTFFLASASYGIFIEDITGNCFNNTISNIFSSSTTFLSSALSHGIFITKITGNCSNNIISKITSFTTVTVFSLTTSFGILIVEITGNSFNNTISDVSSTSINPFFSTAASYGVLIVKISDNHVFSCNTVKNITSDGIETAGVRIDEGNNLTIRGNIIDVIHNLNGPACGLLLGNNNNLMTNSLVYFNTISNITGNNNNGFGISIENVNSTGNDLLNNSIFDINGKAINIIDNGVPVDATVTLQSAVCGANKVFIRGTLEPEPGFEDSEFLVQFFASNSNTPPQAMTFVGETTIQADDTTSFVAEIKSCTTDTTQFITATATALPEGSTENNNTSEVSNAVPGCDSSTICSLFCSPVPTPPVCPLR